MLLGTMAACGYSIKSEKDLRSYEMQIDNLQHDFAQTKELIQKEKDSINNQMLIKEMELERFKDSVGFMKLDRQMCYTTGPHRHSCEIYK